MEPESSLPHSQAPVTCPYSETDQSSQYLPIPRLEDSFYYYPPIYAYVFQVVLSNMSPQRIPLCTSPVTHTCLMPRPSNSS
jgi:hypothetical protein